MTYPKLVSSVQVSAVSQSVGEISLNELFVSTFEVDEVLNFVSFESVSAKESVTTSKEVSFRFWFRDNDLVSFMESVSFGEAVPSSLIESVSRTVVFSSEAVLDALERGE